MINQYDSPWYPHDIPMFVGEQKIHAFVTQLPYRDSRRICRRPIGLPWLQRSGFWGLLEANDGNI